MFLHLNIEHHLLCILIIYFALKFSEQSVKRDFSLSFPQKTEKLAKAYYFQRNRTNFQEELISTELKKYEDEQKLKKKAYYDMLRQKQNLSSQQFDPKSIKMPFAFFYDKELQIERLKRFYPEVAQAYGISLDKKYVDTMV